MRPKSLNKVFIYLFIIIILKLYLETVETVYVALTIMCVHCTILERYLKNF